MSCEHCTYGYDEPAYDFKPYYDDYGNVGEISVDSSGGYYLQVKSDGVWAGVKINNCPWCGERLGDCE